MSLETNLVSAGFTNKKKRKQNKKTHSKHIQTKEERKKAMSKREKKMWRKSKVILYSGQEGMGLLNRGEMIWN